MVQSRCLPRCAHLTRGRGHHIGRRRLPLVVRSQSGFGDESDAKKGGQRGQKKSSKRGKVSSRQDPNVQLRNNLKEFEEAVKSAEAANDPSFVDNVVDVDLDASSSDTVPEVVTNRMLKRIAIFAGSPVVFGMLLFPLFYYIKKVQGIDLPVWAVYIVQTTIFGGGLLGISYGIISTSFDERREGSFLGWNEFKANLPQVLSSFGGRK